MCVYAAVAPANVLPVKFLYTTYGPCSTNRPNMEVPPGPPCSQSITGALARLGWWSKQDRQKD